MKKMSSKMKLSYVFGLAVVVLIYCEYIHYFVVTWKCRWPMSGASADILHLMAVADTHLLGSRNGHWFDKLRREWQMHRAFQTSINLHKPDVVVFLGDLFDEGKWCSGSEFAEYIRRFKELFYVPPSVKVLVTAGNHDIGFHYRTNGFLVSRFEKAFSSRLVQLKIVKGIPFVLVNSVAMHGDRCDLCDRAATQLNDVARILKCWKNPEMKGCGGVRNISSAFSSPVLLQHYPMFRHSDASCSEVDEAPSGEKNAEFRERWECLSRSATSELLRKIEPRLILSGHTHHGCRRVHNYTFDRGSTEKRSALEYSVASLSWRNKVNPTLAMVSLSRENFQIYKCELPNENTVIAIYATFLICTILYVFMRIIKFTKLLRLKSKCK